MVSRPTNRRAGRWQHPLRAEELRFTTPLRIGECRARLQSLLHDRLDVKEFFFPSLAPEPQPLEGTVSTYAFTVRKYTGISRRWKLEARGALHPVADGTLVHIQLGEPVEILVGVTVLIPLIASGMVVLVIVLAHQVSISGDFSAVLQAVLLTPILAATIVVLVAIQRFRGRGDRDFLRQVLMEALDAPHEPGTGPTPLSLEKSD